MRGYYVTTYIKPSELKLQSGIPEPVPKAADEVVVEVYSAGLNYFDILQVQGKYQNQPPFPWVPGTEFAGVIPPGTSLPPDCPFRVGDRVFGAAQGACGERLVCSWTALQKIPDGMTFDEAASLTVTWPTSYEALVGRAQVKPGEWVLVHAAAGGVGLIAVQIAKALGAKVIATAGSPDKLDVCKRHGGADEAVNYRDPSWQKKVMQISNGHGVDVVYDPVGLVEKSLKVIAWKGRILIVGFAAGSIEKIPMNLVLLKNMSLVGVHWGAYFKREPRHVPDVWSALLKLYKEGKLKPVTYPKIFQFSEFAEGLRAIEARETWGKAILRIRDADIPRAKL